MQLIFKRIGAISLMLGLLLTVMSCKGNKEMKSNVPVFTNDILLKTTPIKQQGEGYTCWIYAMLATIETDRIEQNDSINLSPAFVERNLITQNALLHFFRKAYSKREMAGMAPLCLRLIQQYGLVPFDSYEGIQPRNVNAINRKAMIVAQQKAGEKATMISFKNALNSYLDDALGALPLNVYLFGAEYTPLQFAQSVVPADSYKAYCSVTHHPFYREVLQESPDNNSYELFNNVPIDSLMNIIDLQLAAHKAVCWEGSLPHGEYIIDQGVARLNPKVGKVDQNMRQRAIESYTTYDQHAMSIVGKAHDEQGNTYYIAKNSWGKYMPFNGFVYLERKFVALRTIAILTQRSAN